MTEQQACTLCGAGGHTAAQCNWRTDATLDKIRGAGLSIDGDNAYKRDLLDCVVGALAFSFQGRPAPEESHWLHRFWEIGNAEREARAALAQPSPAPELEAPTAVGALILGGAFSSTELGDNDVTLDSQVVERLQREMVKDSEDIAVELMLVGQHDRIVGALRADRDNARRTAEYWKAEHVAANAALDAAQAMQPVAWVTETDPEVTMGRGINWFPKNVTKLPVGTKLYADPVAQAWQVPQAWLDVQAERRRQVEEEGWAPEHDDEHTCDEIAAYACFFIMPPAARDWDASSTGYGDTLGAAILPPDWLPKIGDRRRELVKGTALALAEIERLDRAAGPAQGGRDE